VLHLLLLPNNVGLPCRRARILDYLQANISKARMAEDLHDTPSPAVALHHSQPSAIPLAPMKIPNGPREQRGLVLDSFSPVNQNGSFEFDRVLKLGQVHKRTRKTKVPLTQPHCHRLPTRAYYDIVMETRFPSSAPKRPIHLQRSRLYEASPPDQSLGPHSCCPSTRPKRQGKACLWPVFSRAELPH
jgi:hypothetical protein